MMHDFIADNRDELLSRCATKVSLRRNRLATPNHLKDGVPRFLEQLRRTLLAERVEALEESQLISGSPDGDAPALSEIRVAAIAHGQALFDLGYTVDQIVRDYLDLCQSVTELAMEREMNFAVSEFHTLYRCLDDAIADTAFFSQRDGVVAENAATAASEKLGVLVDELRNALLMANLSVRAMELGGLTLTGATGTVLKRSLSTMRGLIDSSVADERILRGVPSASTVFSLAAFVQDAQAAAEREADILDCVLLVASVDPALRVEADRDLLLGALANLLSNAFKFNDRYAEVKLSAYARDDRLFIEVEDQRGELAPGYEEAMFKPFAQGSEGKGRAGFGLSIARQSIEAMGGTLTVKNLEKVRCVFTIELAQIRRQPADVVGS